MLLDIHIIRRPKDTIKQEYISTFETFFNQCLSSLNIIPNINLNILQGNSVKHFYFLRKEGYSHGNAQYVSHVNDDDYIIGNPFLECIEELEKNKNLCGVYTNSYISNINKTYNLTPFYNHKQWDINFHITHPRPIHELVVIRRNMLNLAFERIENFIKLLSPIERDYMLHDAEQTIYTALAYFGEWKFLPNVFGYVWRQHSCGRHKYVNDENKLSFEHKQELKIKLLKTLEVN